MAGFSSQEEDIKPKAGFSSQAEAPAAGFSSQTAEPMAVSTLTGKPVPAGPIGSPDNLRMELPPEITSVPRAGLMGDTFLQDPSKRPAPPNSIIQNAPGAVTQYWRHLMDRIGLAEPGLVKTPIDIAMLPLNLGAEALDVPYRLIHSYQPGEGGVSPGEAAKQGVLSGLLAAGGSAGVTEPLRRAQSVRTMQAIGSPEGKAIMKELAEAAGRGETGMVSGATAEKLKALDMPSGNIKRLLATAKEAEASTILAPAGKPTVKVTQPTAQALANVLSKISVGESEPSKLPSGSDLYRDYVDALNPLKKLLDKTVDPAKLSREDPYELFRLLPGTWGKVDSFLAYKRFDINTYRFEGSSLADILKPVKPDLQAFRAFYAARQALDLEKAGIMTGFDPKDLRTVVKTLSPKFAETATSLTNYNNSLLRQLLGSGIIGPDEYKKMVMFHKHYAPMWRLVPDRNVVFSRSAEEAMRQQMQGLQAGKPLRRLEGSAAPIHDPLESVVRNTYLYLRAADKNLAMRSMIDLARKDANWAKMFKRVPSALDEAEISIPDDALAASLREAKISPDTLKALTPNGFLPRPNTIAVWENGKRTLYETHPDIARVVKALDKEEIGAWVKILSAPARVLRAGAVLSPEFIARNPIRDQLSAYIFSKHGYIPGVDFVRGIAKAFGQDEAYWQWKIAGGEHAMLVSLDRVALQEDLARVLRKYGGLELSRPGWHRLNPIETLRLYSALGEKGTRLGEFLKAQQQLGTTKEALQKAAFASREVSLDFARAGAKGRALNMLVAFWNAQVQGLDKLGRSFAERPLATSGKIAASITLPSVILAAVNAGDGRWSELPQWQKDLFWVVPQGYVSKADWARMTPAQKVAFNKEHPIWRIPKPFELGVAFGSGPERFVEWLADRNPKVIEHFLGNLMGAASPGVIPTAALPALEIWGNKSVLSGAPVVSAGQEQLLPRNQAKADTPETLKLISRVIADMAGDSVKPPLAWAESPVYLESLVRNWSGGLGHYALMLTDELLELAGAIKPPVKPAARGWEKTPVIRGFIVNYPGTSVQPLQDFFAEYDLASRRLSNAQQLAMKRGDVSAVQDISARSVALQGYHTAISNILSFSSMVSTLPEFTPQQRRELIDQRIFEALAIAQQALKKADELAVPAKKKAGFSSQR